jgi:hypothetical protein
LLASKDFPKDKYSHRHTPIRQILPNHPKSRSNERRSRLSILPIQQMRNQDQIAINANIITLIAEDLRLRSSNI